MICLFDFLESNSANNAMKQVREKQDRLAKLHFELYAAQDHIGCVIVSFLLFSHFRTYTLCILINFVCLIFMLQCFK